MSEFTIELVFKHSGGCELRSVDIDAEDDANDTVIWSSDADNDFTESFGNEIMSGDTDAEKVLDYLVENEIIDDDEAADIDIYDESLDAKELDSDD